MMQEQILTFFHAYKELAFLVSVLINILIAVAGVIPSFFITGANIAFFGFWPGMMVSLAGEAAGALVSFYLYRRGFGEATSSALQKYPRIKRLVDSQGMEGFYLVILFRLLPFFPSGIVTFAAAAGKVSFKIFAAASTLGKIPALFIESISVYKIMSLTKVGEILIELFLILLVYGLWKKRKKD